MLCSTTGVLLKVSSENLAISGCSNLLFIHEELVNCVMSGVYITMCLRFFGVLCLLIGIYSNEGTYILTFVGKQSP